MSATMITEMAPAKLNLTLSVLGLRDDGYHELDSLVVFTKLGDRLTSTLGEQFSLTVSGPFGDQIIGKNIVVEVGEALCREVPQLKLGAIQLEKILPVAGGIGGGSADAGALLRLARRIAIERPSDGQLAVLGGRFGADVPVCFESIASFIRGFGDDVEPLDKFPEMGVVLVNPRQPVETARVFRRLEAPQLDIYEETPERPQFSTSDDVIDYMQSYGNDLLIAAIATCPAITHMLGAIEDLPLCRIARLSGSGATCFGLFNDEASAQQAALELREEFPEWWIEASMIPKCG